MAIQQQEYIFKKFTENWDFQRKKKYNKERIFAMADKICKVEHLLNLVL